MFTESGTSKTPTAGKTGTVYELRKMTDEAYIPTVLIGGSPIKSEKSSTSASSLVESGGGGGTAYEEVNLLSSQRIEQFMVTEKSTTQTPLQNAGTWYYKLPLSVAPIERVDKVEKIDADGNWQTVSSNQYFVNELTGLLTFNEALEPSPLSDIGAGDNYRVTYTVSYSGKIDSAVKTYGVSSKTDNTPLHPPSVPSRINVTVPLYRFYIGNELESVDDVTVTFHLADTSGYGRSSSHWR